MSARVGSGGLQRGFLLSTNDSSTKAKPTAKQKSNNKKSNQGMKAGFLLTHSSKKVSTEKAEEVPQKRATTRSKDKKEEQSKLKQPGIAKGFLLSQPKAPKTKKDKHVDNRKSPPGQKKLTPPTNLSKELLDLETPAQQVRPAAVQSSSSLLFLEREDDDKPNSRSTLISSNESSRTPLISVLNESAASDRSTGKTAESESTLTAAQPLISIIKDSSPSDEVAGTHALTVPTMTTESQSAEYTTTMPNFSDSLNDTIAGPSSAHIEKSQADTETDQSMTFLEFQQVLLNMDWKDSLLGDKMVISWPSVYVSWAWMWLLDDASDSCPWLSRALLRHHPLSVKEFLSPIKPADKQKTLRILRFVQDYQCPTSKAEVPNNDWGMKILPHLCHLADQQKRSVLAQEAWNVSIMMINIICVNGIQNWDVSTSDDLKMRVEYLLDLQLGWKVSKRHKDTRSAAKRFLLREWIEASKACSDALQWRQLVQGHPLDMDGQWGGLLHVCSSDRYYLSHNDDRDTPMIAWHILFDEKSTSNPAAIDRVLLLRGLLVDFTSNKKTESDSLQEEAIGRVLCTLDKVACKRECAIIVWMLRVLWCSTGGLPPDLKNFDLNGLPQSIEILMSKVVSISSRGAGEALADLLAESVLSLDDSTAAIERLTSEHGLNDSTILLLSRISSLGVACSVNKDTKGTELKCFLQDIFITRLADCKSVRIYLQSPESYTIWQQNDCSHNEAVMTRLYDIMLTTQQNDSVYIEVQSAVAVAMAMMLEVSLSERKGDTVLKTIVCFDFERFDYFLQMWGQACRERLLTRKATQDTLFTDLVLACASAVFLSPSDPSLLAVFGAILGRNLRTSDLSGSYAQTRVCSAIDAIMGVCTEKLNESLNNWEDVSIFQRLAPLLLIRRVPIRYFVSVRTYKSKTSDTEEYEKWIPSLASSLATLIGFDDEDGDKNLTREEKRLAAEVAGRVLRFGGNHLSAFQCACAPFFADIVELCIKGHTVSRKNSVILLRKGRLALYAACCSFEMLEAGVDAYYEEYINVVHVALHVLRINQIEEATGTCQKEWDQLQKGCVEYLAICLLQAYRVSSLEYTPFRQVSQIIQNALRDGSLELRGNEWILANTCMEPEPVPMTVDGITEMRLFNTLTLVAQRADVTDGTLGRFAESTAWLIRWINAKHHPIVTAAAMQMVFTLMTRSRSLGCFDEDPRNAGRRLRDWALTELQMDINRGSLNEVLRLSALKLVLCLLSLGRLQSSSNQNECDQFISPEWMTDCMDTIENLARYDPSDDVRNLSSQVLGML